MPKVADFGLAWVREDPASLTQTGAVLGSIPFMSPEQRRGEPAGPASDLYSLAATLLFLATGAVPGDLYVEATWERASRVGYPLVRVLGLAGRLDPQERFGSAKEMGEALRSWRATAAPTFSREVLSAHLSEMFEAERREDAALYESYADGSAEESASMGEQSYTRLVGLD